MKPPARAEQERREAEISAVAEQLEQWFPGKGWKVAAALSEQIARRKPTRIEWAAQDIHVEVALDYNLGPEDPDAHLFGPGGWHIDCAVDLHVNAHVLQPEVLGWRRERVPDWPDSEGIAPDWACEVLEHTPQAEQQKLRALYARAGSSNFGSPICPRTRSPRGAGRGTDTHRPAQRAEATAHAWRRSREHRCGQE